METIGTALALNFLEYFEDLYSRISNCEATFMKFAKGPCIHMGYMSIW